MLNFNSYLTEQKNTHMEHIEDNVLNGGVDGAREAINFLRSLRDMLSGNSNTAVDATVKWDGAPAIFAGVDPNDGKFFVAKKGIFNKNPKVYKTNADVESDTSGDLATKLKMALQYFSALGITGVVQGDLLFTQGDTKDISYDGVEHITFHPNTIVYAVPKDSVIGRKVARARIGVVWHTTYTGDSFETMRATFAKPIASSLKDSVDVFSTDAVYRDVSGKAMMTAKETDDITKILSDAGKIFNKIDKYTLNGISDNEELLMRTKTFMNTKVRSGERVTDTTRLTNELVQYLMDYFGKEEALRKTEKGKSNVRVRQGSVMEYFTKTDKRKIKLIFDLMNKLVDAKNIIIKKMDQAKTINTLLLTKDGYKATGQEGFVAVDRMKGNAVKLVDRLQFSHANFSADVQKGWQK
tara:strand:+ start:1886 stop:3115 length:1230 start_codon:yes stop_codon:yes gene_type:complete